MTGVILWAELSEVVVVEEEEEEEEREERVSRAGPTSGNVESES